MVTKMKKLILIPIMMYALTGCESLPEEDPFSSMGTGKEFKMYGCEQAKEEGRKVDC